MDLNRIGEEKAAFYRILAFCLSSQKKSTICFKGIQVSKGPTTWNEAL